jgi:hypothetical protein
MAEAVSPLVREVLTGSNPGLLKMAAEGLLPVAPEELLPLQLSLTRHPLEEVAQTAVAALKKTEPKVLASFLTGDVDAEAMAFFATEVRHPAVLEVLLRRRDVPRALLMELARTVGEDLQELLLLRQDAIVEEPRILDSLEENPRLSSYAVRRIREYREHLLPRSEPEPKAPAAEPAEVEEAELEAALEVARGRGGGGERDEGTGLSEAQIRTLAVPVRLTLARGASRSMRSILLRDPNPQVAVAVLKSNALGEQEVELICHNRSICEEVLEEIARRREWVRRPAIVYALVQNPRTPAGIAIRFVPRLSVRELRELSRNRNVPDAVRSRAQRLYRVKRQ